MVRRIWDVDGNEYIDYIGSWGPLISGHRSSLKFSARCRKFWKLALSFRRTNRA